MCVCVRVCVCVCVCVYVCVCVCVMQAESDVVGCKRDSLTDVVHVLDSWNPGPQGIHIANILDQNQNGVCTHETQFVNGQISCT